MELYKLNLNVSGETDGNIILKSINTLGGALVVSGQTIDHEDGNSVAGVTIMNRETSIPKPLVGNLLNTESCLVTIADVNGVAVWTATSGSGYYEKLAVFRPGYEIFSGSSVSVTSTEVISGNTVINLSQTLPKNDKIAIIGDLEVLSTDRSGMTYTRYSGNFSSTPSEFIYTPTYGGQEYAKKFPGFNLGAIPSNKQTVRLSTINVKKLPTFINTYHAPSTESYVRLFDPVDGFHQSAITGELYVNSSNKEIKFADGTAIGGWAVSAITNNGDRTAARFTISPEAKNDYIFCDCSWLISSRVLYQNNVGEGAFLSNTNLQYVELGDTVTEIRGSAFETCENLEWVDCKTINSIGEFAFSDCYKLKAFDFGSGSTLNSISNYCFNNCYQLSSITIPSTVTNIGQAAFSCTTLKSIRIPSGCTQIQAHAFFSCTQLTSVTFEDISTLEYIGPDAFCGCINLQTIIDEASQTNGEFNPSNLRNLGDSAFSGCTKLAVSVHIPETLKTCGTHIFDSCYKLSSVDYDASVMGDYMFQSCSGITNVNFGDALSGVSSYAFYGCRSIENLFMNNVKTVNLYAFYSATTLETVTFVKTDDIKFSAFSRCSQLSNVVFENKIVPYNIATTAFQVSLPTSGHIFYIYDSCSGITTHLSKFGSSWDVNQMTEVTPKLYSNGITINIDASSFSGTHEKWLGYYLIQNEEVFEPPYSVTGTQTIMPMINGEMADNVKIYLPFYKKLPPSVFSGSTNLEKIMIPAQINEICANAFYNCQVLTDVEMRPTSLQIRTSAFRRCTNIPRLTLPVFTGETTCFSGCTKLKKITYTGNVAPSITADTFKFIASYGVLSHPNTNSIGSMLSTSEFYLGYYHWIDESELEDWDTFIYSAATNVLTTLSSLNYANTFNSGGGGTSGGTSGDTSGGTTGDFMYVDGEPKPVASAITFTQSMDSNLHVVRFPYGHMNTVSKAFYGITALHDVILSPNSRIIPASAFTNCSMLTNVEASNIGIGNFGSNAFANCPSLERAIIDGNYLAIPQSSFDSGTSLQTVYFPKTVTSIGTYAFRLCHNLENISDYSRVRSIGAQAFRECESLVNLNFGNVESVSGASTFSGCTSLVSLTFGSGSTETLLSTSWVRGCSNLTTLVLPPTIITIQGYVFDHCSSLSSLTIPNSVASIGAGSLRYMSSLKQIICLTSSCTIADNTTFRSIRTGGTLYYVTGGTVFNNFMNVGTTYYLNYYKWSAQTIGEIDLSFNITSTSDSTTIGYNVANNAYGIISGSTFYPPSNEFVFPTTGIHTLKLLWKENTTGYRLFYSDFIVKMAYRSNTNPMVEICPNFSSVTIENNVSEGFPAFGETGLKRFNMNNTTYTYLGGSFVNTELDATLSLPNTLVTLNNTFLNCYTLPDSDFPNSLRNIYFKAFQNCWTLHTVDLNNVNVVTEYSFANCYTLTSVTGHHLTTLGSGVFQNCSGLTNVNLSGSTFTKVGNYAFDGCKSLGNIKLPITVKTIGSNAFRYCEILSGITFGNGQVNVFEDMTIEDYAFYQTGIFTLYGYEEQIIFYTSSTGHTNIGNYAFSNSEIGYSATEWLVFSGNTGNVTCGDFAFDMKNIQVVLVDGSALPTLGNNTFYNFETTTELHLSSSLQQTFEENADWNNYPWAMVDFDL